MAFEEGNKLSPGRRKNETAICGDRRVIGVRVTDEEYERIKEAAKRERRTMSGLVTWVLVTYINSEEARIDIAAASAKGNKGGA